MQKKKKISESIKHKVLEHHLWIVNQLYLAVELNSIMESVTGGVLQIIH